MRKVNDNTSREMVVFDLELVPQGPEIRIPKTALRNKLEHKNTDKSEHGGRMRHDMERCAEIETWCQNKLKTSVFASVLRSWKPMSKLSDRAREWCLVACQVRSTEMIVDSDRHE